VVDRFFFGREIAIHIATETADLSADLRRGLSYLRKHGRAQGRNEEGDVVIPPRLPPALNRNNRLSVEHTMFKNSVA
jgi:hypothetical protein